MRRALRPTALLAFVVGVSGCDPSTAITQEQLASIEAWLTCDECIDGERERVEAMGPSAVPPLELVLRSVPEVFRDNMRSQYAELYAMLSAPPVDSATFVDGYLASFDATVQSRAAAALGDLGEWQVLEEARDAAGERGYPPELVATIEANLLRSGEGAVDGPGPVASWTLVQPGVPVQVCNGANTETCAGVPVTLLSAAATGAAGIPSPWARVHFYRRAPGSDAAWFIGASTSPAVVDTGLERTFTWTIRFGPFGLPVGPLEVFAIGVTSAGQAFRTPPNDHLTVIEGR